MTASTTLTPGLAPYLTGRLAEITAATASLQQANGLRFASVDLGAVGKVLIQSAEQAREIAAAFAAAAMLLLCPECGEDAPYHTAQCTLRPGAPPVAVPEVIPS